MAGSLEMLGALAASGAEVHLTNVYKGVPLSFPARILATGEGVLQVTADKYQLVCMYLEKETYLQSSLLPDILRARVLDMDLPEQTALLGRFVRVRSNLGERMQVRVQPDAPLRSDIVNQPGGVTLHGELADISQDGLGLFLGREYFLPRHLYTGALIRIHLYLPGLPQTGPYRQESPAPSNPMERFDRGTLRTGHIAPRATSSLRPGGERSPRPADGLQVEVRGKVVNLTLEPGKDRYRIGVGILPNDPSRPAIARFINARQAEMIRELKSMYDLLTKTKGE